MNKQINVKDFFNKLIRLYVTELKLLKCGMKMNGEDKMDR